MSKHDIKAREIQVEELVNKLGKILSKSVASYSQNYLVDELGDLDLLHKGAVKELVDNSGGIKGLTIEETNPVDAEEGDVNIMPNGQFWQYSDEEWEFLGKLDLPTFSGKILVVDSTNGNDLTAKKGSFEFRYKTLDSALLSAVDDDTIHVFSGQYIASENIWSAKNLSVYMYNAQIVINTPVIPIDVSSLKITGIGSGNSIVQYGTTSTSLTFNITGKAACDLYINNVDIHDSKTGSQIGTIRVRDSDNCRVYLKDVTFYTRSCPIFYSSSDVNYLTCQNVRTRPYPGYTLLNNIVIALNTDFKFINCEFEGYSQTDVTSNYQYGGLVGVGVFAYTGIKGLFKDCTWNDLGTLAGLVITQNQAEIRFEGTNTFKSETAANSILKITTVTGDAGNSIAVDLAGEVTYNKPIGYNGVDDNIVFNRLDTTDGIITSSSVITALGYTPEPEFIKNSAFNRSFAIDAELETQTTPTEDNKVVSRRGLIYWFNWLKTQAITWTGIHRFSSATGTEIAVVKILDGATYRNALSRLASGILSIGGTGWTSIKFENPINNLIHTKGSPALVEANEDGSIQPGPVMTSLTITHPSVIAILQNEVNWDGSLFIGDLTGYEDQVEQGKYRYIEETGIRYDCQENDVITRTFIGVTNLFSAAGNTLMPATETTASTYTFPANSVVIGHVFAFDYFGGLFVSETIDIRFKLNGTTWFTYSTPTTGAWKCNVEMIIIDTNTAALVFEFKTSAGISLERYNVTFTFASSNTISLTTESVSASTIAIYKALGRKLA